MGAERHQTSDMVRALNMYGVYNFSQLEELQDQVGSQVSAFNNADQESAKRQRIPEVNGYQHPIEHQGAVGQHAFQAVYPGHPSHSTHDEYDDDEKEDGQNDLMLGEPGARSDQPRTYRDPEKRREQNRRASQRARQRARQREEQVVMLQQQLHLMANEMTTMQVQLDGAKQDVKREQVLSTIRANRELEATATNPEARSYSFSHPPLRIENRQRLQQHQGNN